MKPIRKVTVVVVTLFLAAATGQVVQTQAGKTTHKPNSTEALAAVPTKVVLLAAGSDQPVMLPDLPDVTPMLPARTIRLTSFVRADDRGLTRIAPDAVAKVGAPAQACTMDLTVESAPAAMLSVRLDAPCRINERVVIRHEGLVITGRTSATGKMQVEVPALAMDAKVTVAFSGGAAVSGVAQVPELADFDRVGVQWQGKDAFELHALEFGATENSRGHVSAVDPRNPSYGERATGGFMLILGDANVPLPMLAEVYSFPAAHMARQGTVRLYLEATVTRETCGREMLGETLDVRQGGRLRTMDLSLPMPGCDAIGQFLVLNNLLPDLKIAQN